MQRLDAGSRGVLEERSSAKRHGKRRGMQRGRLDQQFGRAQFAQPEADGRWRWVRATPEVVRLEQAADHGPILVALGLLRGDEILDAEHRGDAPVRQRDLGSPFPELWKVGDVPHLRHDVDAHARGVPVTAAEVHGVSAEEEIGREWRHGDDLRVEFRQCGGEPLEVRGLREDGEVRIAAKLRRAVEHAGLPARQERLHALRLDRRKDFAYRVRDQASLPSRGMRSRGARFRASAPRD